jgi:caa(3)-type oxidase subunit IV
MTHDTHQSHYVKIWVLLLILLAISIIGPMFEIKAVTLITAFGIAIVKAFIVAKHFMHLNLEKKYISYMLIGMILFMFVLFAGVSPDVLKQKGTNWIKNQTVPLEQPTHAEETSH